MPTPFRDAVLADSPQFYWDLNESSGTTATQSGSQGSSNGTHTNGPVVDQAGLTEDVGDRSVLYDGDDDHTVTANVSVSMGMPRVLEAIVQTTSSNRQVAVAWGRWDANHYYALGTNGGKAEARVRPGTSEANETTLALVGTSNINDGEPHHIVAVWISATERYLYVDGVLEDGSDDETSGSIPSGTSNRRFSVGVRPGSTPQQYWTGRVGHAVSYNADVSSARVAAHFDASGIAEPPGNSVTHAWQGGVTTTGFAVVAKIAQAGTARLVVSTSSDLSDPILGSVVTSVTRGSDELVRLTVSGLTPGTAYHWGIETDGEWIDNVMRGRVRTFPSGAASFEFLVGCCAGGGTSDWIISSVSNHPVFEAMVEEPFPGATDLPLFLLHEGDLHYRDINTDDQSLFRAAYRDVLAQPRQSLCYRHIPIAYFWDDHDYGSNDSDGTSASRPAALATYREWVPHWPIGLSGPANDTPICQEFRCGRVHVIGFDARSERTPKGATDNAAKVMVGAAQEEWIKARTLHALGTGAMLVVWAVSTPWIGTGSTNDHWGGYSTARKRLANFLREYDIEANVLIVAGDMHALAYDDGSNSQYADDSGDVAGPVVIQGGSFDSTGSSKGGPWSSGTPDEGRGRVQRIVIVDDGDTFGYSAIGYLWDIAEQEWDQRTILLPVVVPTPPVLPPPADDGRSAYWWWR